MKARAGSINTQKAVGIPNPSPSLNPRFPLPTQRSGRKMGLPAPSVTALLRSLLAYARRATEGKPRAMLSGACWACPP